MGGQSSEQGGCVGALTGREKEPAIRECAWDSSRGAHSMGRVLWTTLGRR